MRAWEVAPPSRGRCRLRRSGIAVLASPARGGWLDRVTGAEFVRLADRPEPTGRVSGDFRGRGSRDHPAQSWLLRWPFPWQRTPRVPRLFLARPRGGADRPRDPGRRCAGGRSKVRSPPRGSPSRWVPGRARGPRRAADAPGCHHPAARPARARRQSRTRADRLSTMRSPVRSRPDDLPDPTGPTCRVNPGACGRQRSTSPRAARGPRPTARLSVDAVGWAARSSAASRPRPTFASWPYALPCNHRAEVATS